MSGYLYEIKSCFLRPLLLTILLVNRVFDYNSYDFYNICLN